MGIIKNAEKAMREEHVDYHISNWKLVGVIVGMLILTKFLPSLAVIIWVAFIIGCAIAIAKEK